MNSLSTSPSPKQSLLLVIFSLWITFLSLRLALHLGGVRHLYPGGHLVHHFFFGAILLIPVAFLLAFPPRSRWLRFAVLAALGVASALLLDEFVYLLATQATDAEYVSRLSFLGALVLVLSASLLLLALYLSRRE